jgi:hypothetical protein
VSDALAAGADGQPRCWWAASAPEYVACHDEGWGRPVHDDRGLSCELVDDHVEGCRV